MILGWEGKGREVKSAEGVSHFGVSRVAIMYRGAVTSFTCHPPIPRALQQLRFTRCLRPIGDKFAQPAPSLTALHLIPPFPSQSAPCASQPNPTRASPCPPFSHPRPPLHTIVQQPTILRSLNPSTQEFHQVSIPLIKMAEQTEKAFQKQHLFQNAKAKGEHAW